MPTEHSITTLEGVVVRGLTVVVRTDFARLGKAPSRQPQGPRCGAHRTDKTRNAPPTPPATLVDAVGEGLRERIDRRAAEPRRHNGETGIGPLGWSWQNANRQMCAKAERPYTNPMGARP